jgi:hypothetical protein
MTLGDGCTTVEKSNSLPFIQSSTRCIACRVFKYFSWFSKVFQSLRVQQPSIGNNPPQAVGIHADKGCQLIEISYCGPSFHWWRCLCTALINSPNWPIASKFAFHSNNCGLTFLSFENHHQFWKRINSTPYQLEAFKRYIFNVNFIML